MVSFGRVLVVTEGETFGFYSTANSASKKKKRPMKPEPDSHHKRRRPQPPRNANVRGNLQGNGEHSKNDLECQS
jgi:hypothetical protein